MSAITSIVDKITQISQTIDSLLDNIAQNESLSALFEKYLEDNKIEIQNQAQLSDVLLSYLLDTKGVLDSCGIKGEVVDALKNSFCSVFKIEQMGKNSIEAYSLTNEIKYTLLPLVKMLHLRSVCKGDFIKARIIKLGGEYFILEIYNVIGASRAHIAEREAIKWLISSPKSAYWENEAKFKEIKKSAKDFAKKFEEFFGKSVVSTTNKKIDELLEVFNKYCESEEKVNYTDLIEEPKQYKYFEDSTDTEADFVQSALGGFSKESETYDVALFCDKEYGIFIIPFYETISRLDDQLALKYLLDSPKNPASMVLNLGENKKFIEKINTILDKKVKNVQELIDKYKEENFSPATILYNSKTFSKLLGYKEKPQVEVVGRNEQCPCGSGKKYKKCCMAEYNDVE